MAKEVITEFRLLSNQAGYANTTPSNHAHLIEKLQMILNPSLVKRVMLLDDVPETINTWATQAIQIDTNYRQTMEMMERIARERRNTKPSKGNNNSHQKGKKKEEKDPDAMDIDGMSAGKRAYLMKKGACFKCKKPGHLARDCEDQETKDKKKKDKGKAPQKKDLKAIHALFKGLTKEEKMELLALSEKKEEAEEKSEEEEDF